MRTYTYTIVIHLVENNHAVGELCTLTGKVQADRYSTACIHAWEEINAECIKTGRKDIAVGELNVQQEGIAA